MTIYSFRVSVWGGEKFAQRVKWRLSQEIIRSHRLNISQRLANSSVSIVLHTAKTLYE